MAVPWESAEAWWAIGRAGALRGEMFNLSESCESCWLPIRPVEYVHLDTHPETRRGWCQCGSAPNTYESKMDAHGIRPSWSPGTRVLAAKRMD